MRESLRYWDGAVAATQVKAAALDLSAATSCKSGFQLLCKYSVHHLCAFHNKGKSESGGFIF